MTKARRWIAAAVLCVIAACSPIERNHGYVPSDAQLEEIIVGVDTKASVEDVIGRPSAAGVLDGAGWYYVRSEFQTRGPLPKQEVDREVVAITFNQDEVVTNIERFGLEEGRVVALSRRVTDSNVEGIGFLRQLFGNIGRLDAAQLLN
ncbi:outer membrane protein assembly factor BamE [Anianabacter salinae]|uniref:outer membrane protein assembly factor BamE n=1 Tax=Anianabacter salinae TaxID=2851023 RepID=UPI00225E6BBB|nr:outer membrane protein assembly factor BamE [Anianabacter salinae]MBV0911908.1 outer membrane protein assembly factor BamE [Anianabacter salinae]